MAETLTPQQAMAVENRGGNLLVSAAAGSGKTKVLVDRLMSFLTDPVTPQNIDSFLMITYTKAAASELRGKIAAKLSQAIAQNPNNRHLQRQMQRLYLTKISTVHSFCADILKEYAYMLDISADFRVADENECVQLQTKALDQVLNAYYEQSEPDMDFYSFVDSQGLGRDDRQVPELVLSVFRKAKCHLDFQGWLDQCVSACDVGDITDAGDTVWGAFLIDDLKKYLKLQILALEKCRDEALAAGDMEKPAALLDGTVVQLNRLYHCRTWDEILSLHDISYGTLTFSKKCCDTDLIDQIKAVRDGCKVGLKKRLRRFTDTSAQLLSDIASTASPVRGLVALVRAFDREYAKLKRSRHILDFSDLEHYTLDLLWGRSRSGITSVAKEVANRYCQIMVDEYQDSNAVQDAIFRALTLQRNNCFMVGDVKQSIYQFRLADPGIFLEKYNRYPVAENAADGEGRKILLSNNFRSGNAVLQAVNDVFYDCMFESVGGLRYTEAEALSEGIGHAALPDPEIELHGISVKEDTYAEESAFVASRIKTLLDNKQLIRDGDQLRPVKAEDIVILLRSPGSVGRMFQNALEDFGIKCAFDNGSELMEAEEIQFLHSMLQTISNPLQDIPLIAVLSSRVFGFTADALAAIRAHNLKSDFYSALQQHSSEKSRKFLSILEQLRLDARMVSVPQLIDRIFMLTDADALYQSMHDGAERMENLNMFSGLAAGFASTGQGNLESFLDYLQIIATEGVQAQTNNADGAVKIMSIHKSKGLEFPVVFLCGLSKAFNMEQTRQQVLCDSDLGLGLSSVDTKRRVRYPTIAKHAIAAKMRAEALSEELRVLYVAMTRPKDRLIMTYASGSLEKELEQLAARMDICDPVLLSSEVGSAGEWVLLAALRHSEAACFHSVARKPGRIRVLEHPWKITVSESAIKTEAVEECEKKSVSVSKETLDKMQAGLNYAYPFAPATQTPSKLTATQLKGRYKDQEIAQGADQRAYHNFRKPEFAAHNDSGRLFGTALHTIMQHIRFSGCDDSAFIGREIQRLTQEGHIDAHLAQYLKPEEISKFFQTEVGKLLVSGVTCVREFKFSVLDPAERYTSGAAGDYVLLQGVVDCALIEDDGITVLDFKTDCIELSDLEKSVAGYRSQVCAYAYALERIYGKQIKIAYLYYFRLGELVSVEVNN